MESTPFTASYSSFAGGVYRDATARGVMRLEADALVLEYREKVTEVSDTDYGQAQGPVREVRIPLETLRSVEVRRRFFLLPVCEVEVSRMAALEPLPWADGFRLRVRVPFRSRDHARDLASSLRLLQAERRLQELGEGGL